MFCERSVFFDVFLCGEEGVVDDAFAVGGGGEGVVGFGEDDRWDGVVEGEGGAVGIVEEGVFGAGSVGEAVRG